MRDTAVLTSRAAASWKYPSAVAGFRRQAGKLDRVVEERASNVNKGLEGDRMSCLNGSDGSCCCLEYVESIRREIVGWKRGRARYLKMVCLVTRGT